MVPFQCSLCHFRNIMLRDPWKDDDNDMEIMEFIVRASLDAFWGRETTTVTKNLTESKRMERTFSRLGMPSGTPPMGPFPVRDDMGMQAAIAVLDRSMDPGKYAEFVQWETFRKTRSCITNVSQAGVGGLGNSIGAYERKKMWISTVATHTFWFERFMEGLHRRVGEIKKQDWPISIEALHEVDKILEKEWNKAKSLSAQKRVTEMGTWLVGGFCTGLRGEEMLMLELAGTAKSLKHLENEKEPHFEMVVLGRTKGNRLSGAKFGIPCVAITEGTNLRPGKWIKRLVACLHGMGRRNGRLFERKLMPTKLCEYEDDFFTVLERVQSTTNVIENDVDLREEGGILRTTRRGLSAHALNMGIDTNLLKAINRWRSETQSAAGHVGADMVDRYTKLEALKPYFLKFSRQL
jgi:hypothetical protein